MDLAANQRSRIIIISGSVDALLATRLELRFRIMMTGTCDGDVWYLFVLLIVLG
jgi:hypothetical protein